MPCSCRKTQTEFSLELLELIDRWQPLWKTHQARFWAERFQNIYGKQLRTAGMWPVTGIRPLNLKLLWFLKISFSFMALKYYSDIEYMMTCRNLSASMCLHMYLPSCEGESLKCEYLLKCFSRLLPWIRNLERRGRSAYTKGNVDLHDILGGMNVYM